MLAGKNYACGRSYVAMSWAMTALRIKLQEEVTGSYFQIVSEHRDLVVDAITGLGHVGQMGPYTLA